MPRASLCFKPSFIESVKSMKYPKVVCSVVATWLLCFSMPLLAAIKLTVVSSGLSNPVFAVHAGDGSNRLFIVEQRGVIKVLQPPTQPAKPKAGASTVAQTANDTIFDRTRSRRKPDISNAPERNRTGTHYITTR